MKRVLLFVLLLCLVVPSGCSALPQTARAYLAVPEQDGGRTAFCDIPAAQPDTDALFGSIAALETALPAAPANELYRAYREAEAAYRALDSAAAQAYLHYCFNITDDDRRHRYDALAAALDEAEARLVDIGLRLTELPALSGKFSGREAAELARADALNAPSVRRLTLRERSLEGEFEKLRQSFAVEYAGRAWTMEQIETDASLSFRDYFALLDAYYDAFNARANAIFGALVETRNEIAAALGFPSYPAYRYAVYGRAYTPEDAAAFGERVKEALVPLYLDAVDRFSNDLAYFYGAAFPQEAAFASFRQALGDAFPALLPAWDGMLELGLYDTGVSGVKMPGSFTTYLSAHRAPFLFTQWMDDGQSVATLAHEFGHFSAFWRNPPQGAFARLDLDLAEVDSQGLELLLLDEYDTLYGRYADAARIHALLGALYAVLSGCMEDAFQQWAYANPGAAAKERNDAYYRIAAEYGFTAVYGYTGMEWVLIDHTFLSPLYYISYAVSMTAALSLWELAGTQPAAARRAYLRIQMRDPGVGLGEALRRNGVADPFGEATAAGIRDALLAFFEAQQAG